MYTINWGSLMDSESRFQALKSVHTKLIGVLGPQMRRQEKIFCQQQTEMEFEVKANVNGKEHLLTITHKVAFSLD